MVYTEYIFVLKLVTLVIQDESHTKRRRHIAGKARGVFRLADTVPGNWVGQGEEGEVLKVSA